MDSTKAKSKVVTEFLRNHPHDAAKVLIKIDPKSLAGFISEYPSKEISICLSDIPSAALAEALILVDQAKATQILELISPNICAAIFRFWETSGFKNESSVFLNNLTKEKQRPIKSLLTFPIGSVGSLMNAVPFSVPPDLNVHDVLSLLQKQKDKYSRYIYVTDSQGILVGLLPFKDAYYADKGLPLSTIMTSSISSLRPNDSAEGAIKSRLWRSWDSLPVTTSTGQLLGVIRYDVLEKHSSKRDASIKVDNNLAQAGAAIGEVFKIGLGATVSTFGLTVRK